MSIFKIALAQYPIVRPESLKAWSASISGWVTEAALGGAKLLVFPEYAAMDLAGLEPAIMSDLQGSLHFVADLHEEVHSLYRTLAIANDVHLIAGSIPFRRHDGRFVNRASLFAPSGKSGFQDKIVMTRFERERWHITGGDRLNVFKTDLGVIGIAICYDIEFPLIARSQAEAGAELIVTPSCTDSMQGYWRVRHGAQARALEGQCFVAQSPTIGLAAWSPVLDENHGLAGLFGPPDGDSPEDGVLSLGEGGRAGWTYGEIDTDRVQRWRGEGAVRPFAHWPEQYLGSAGGLPACEIVDLR